MKYKFIFSSFLFILIPILISAQVADSLQIQFSGFVITADSIIPIPYVKIANQGNSTNTVGDSKGYFSIKVKKKDVLNFSCLGYKPTNFIIPDSITKNHYFILQKMESDTLVLNEIDILRWVSYEQFKGEFITTEVNKSEMDRARKNIEFIQKTLFTAYLPMDSYANFKNSLAKMWQSTRSKGQMTMIFSIGF